MSKPLFAFDMACIISWRIMYFPDAYIYIGSWTVELVVEIICCNPILFREFYLSKLLMVAGYLTLLYFLWSLVFKLYLHQNGYGYSQNLRHGICSGCLQRAARAYFGFAYTGKLHLLFGRNIRISDEQRHRRSANFLSKCLDEQVVLYITNVQPNSTSRHSSCTWTYSFLRWQQIYLKLFVSILELWYMLQYQSLWTLHIIPHLTASSIYLCRCMMVDSGIKICKCRVFMAETSRSCFSSLLRRAVFALLPHLRLLGFVVLHSSLNRILCKHAAVELYWWKRQVLCNLTEKQSSRVNYGSVEFASKDYDSADNLNCIVTDNRNSNGSAGGKQTKIFIFSKESSK